MAVEARHLSIFPQQLLGNRVIMKAIEANSNISNTQNQTGYGLPLSGTTTAETFIPVISDSFPRQKPVIKTDSNLPPPSRKRSRESLNPLLSYPSIQTTNYNKSCTPFSFFGHDMSLQIQEQQLEVDCLISQHMEKVRIEIEERRKRQARRLMDAIEESVMMKLKAKEEEIEKIGKLNWALEERVKSLCMENQIWRDLAQTNEATANALRTNLEQVLAAARGLEEEIVDDAESCWEDNTNNCGGDKDGTDQIGSSRFCRNCSKEESCVLLLPCRHLCLCSACGSCLHTCPVCQSPNTRKRPGRNNPPVDEMTRTQLRRHQRNCGRMMRQQGEMKVPTCRSAYIRKKSDLSSKESEDREGTTANYEERTKFDRQKWEETDDEPPPIVIQFGSMPPVVANHYLLSENFKGDNNEGSGNNEDVYNGDEIEFLGVIFSLLPLRPKSAVNSWHRLWGAPTKSSSHGKTMAEDGNHRSSGSSTADWMEKMEENMGKIGRKIKSF